MTPVELSRTVLRAVRRAVDEGELSVVVPVRAVVTPPGPGGCGDYATNIALQLARPAGRPAQQVAEILRPHLTRSEGVADVEITGPGFLNIRLGGGAGASLVREIQRQRDAYGHGDVLAGQIVPLRIPYDIRAEVVADTLVRIVATQGGRAEVHHIHPSRAEPAATEFSRAQPAGTDLSQAKTAGAEPSHAEPPRTEAPHADPPRTKAPQADPPRPHRPRPHPRTTTLRPTPAPEDPTPLGPDAARWALLHPASHDRPRISADHLLQRESNPLFRVRYAHARTRALTRNAAALGCTGDPGDVPEDVPGGDELVGALAGYPAVLTQAALHRAPDRLARHLVTTADALLAFQHTVLPLGDEKPSAAHRARLALAEAAGTVLAGGLSLLGISAPDYL
ncbi:DALR anticodon-binding domain-containing protein [Streptomyces mirabilis]|uniref:ArgS-related anticodon-binding protein NrtL n=1 Tax=Streptomyces mirabilis TaxID=68239 RepID=UPI0021BEE634|nr:DALR anticodon-binding domain-containing protein [Streptomyces mirabilis]MCT9109434.1 DALR anticodon-binding domain-containing protein [Streptomyces mirabilis]